MNENMPQQNLGEVCFHQSWTLEDFVRNLRELRVERNEAQKRAQKVPRKALTAKERNAILSKTGGRCHICGGHIDPGSYWEADHVLRRAAGGGNKSDNYLAAHGLCNTYRWDHLPGEMQWVLKIGVWARMQMEKNSEFGRKMTKLFFENELRREGRKKSNKPIPLETMP
jgi:5-methylcytosine-specific restriction endonuclease McrA